jgi:hypothetical protein
MPMDRPCGPSFPGPRSAKAGAVRRAVIPVAALFVVAALTAGCGAASTPLEVYQNCLRCGYDFTRPIPTAAAALQRANAAGGQIDPALAAYTPR